MSHCFCKPWESLSISDVISSDKEGAGESDGDAGDEDGSVEESQGEESPEPVDGESSDTIPDSTDTQKDELWDLVQIIWKLNPFIAKDDVVHVFFFSSFLNGRKM